MITISPAGPDDARAIATLLEEMDRFYGSASPEPLDHRVRQITEALFADPPAAHALLAWDDADRRRLRRLLVPVAGRRLDPLAVLEGAIRQRDAPA